MKQALHYVGFTHPNIGKDSRLSRAMPILGPADFVHRHWDYRAIAEVLPGDTVIFGCEPAVQLYSYDDSDNQ